MAGTFSTGCQVKLKRETGGHCHEAYGGKNPNGISWVQSHGWNTWKSRQHVWGGAWTRISLIAPQNVNGTRNLKSASTMPESSHTALYPPQSRKHTFQYSVMVHMFAEICN